MEGLLYRVEADDMRHAAHLAGNYECFAIIEARTRPVYARKAFLVFKERAIFEAYMRGLLTEPPVVNVNSSIF